MRQAPMDFLRRLRKIDPALTFRWNEAMGRWQLVRLYSKGRTKDGAHVKDVKKFRLAYQGHVGEQPVYRMSELGAVLGTLSGPDGQYRELNDSVLEDIRSADQWKKDIDPVAAFDQRERDLKRREEKFHHEHMEMIEKETNRFVNWLYTDKIDLGAKT